MKLFELQARVLSESPVPWDEVNGIYLFTQTKDNERSVLNRGASVWRKTKRQILVCDGETDHDYPGYEPWRKELLSRGVLPQWIIPIHTPYEININTLSEAQSLVRTAKRNRWETLVVSSAPFHQLRAFISTVSVLLKEYPALRVYSQVGFPLRWDEYVCHSQGTLFGKRCDLINTELERIHRYHLKGDLVSPEEVLSYLDARDATGTKEECR